MQNCSNGFTITLRSEVRGASFIEDFFVVDAVVRVWNGMSKLTNECGIMDAFNTVFERYFPDENGANASYDNAYVILFEKLEKELNDKLSPTLGRLPTGRVVYLDEEEPLTFNPSTGEGWCRGYIK